MVLRGRPAAALVDDARRMAAELIVASRGHGTIETMLLGSVPAEVIDHAMTPVLVARCRRIDRVLLAWDGSTGAARAAELLCRWPIFARSSVRVVSVADIKIPWWPDFPGAGSPELMEIYLAAADASRSQHDLLASEMTVKLQAAGPTAEADRREGDAATEILAAAQAFKADLILLGTRGRTGVGPSAPPLRRTAGWPANARIRATSWRSVSGPLSKTSILRSRPCFASSARAWSAKCPTTSPSPTSSKSLSSERAWMTRSKKARTCSSRRPSLCP